MERKENQDPHQELVAVSFGSTGTQLPVGELKTEGSGGDMGAEGASSESPVLCTWLLGHAPW